MKSNFERKYDLRPYPDCAPLDLLHLEKEEYKKIKCQFEYLQVNMIPDIYSKIYDLQKRYNDLAQIFKELIERQSAQADGCRK